MANSDAFPLKALAPLLMLAVLLSGCAPSRTPVDGGAPGASGPTAKKILIVGVNREPATIQGFAAGGSNTSRGNTETNMVHARLAIENADEVWEPQIAVEVPSIAAGSWRINPDGSMDLTWKLRPGARWHDGAPFTTADLVFTWSVYKDRDLPHPYAQQMRIQESVSAPDASTLVVHWSQIENRAHEARGLSPLPKHLLEDLYRTDKDAFANSPLFADEFVGLGPYRMARWERGSHMEMTRFDDYFLGRAPVDGIVVRFIPDPNTMVANALAGAVDVVLPPGLDLDAAMEVKRQWEGSGNLVRTGSLPWFLYLEVQYRPEFARPANALANPAVRRGLYHAIDRQSLAEVMTHGTAPIADSWYRPGTPLRTEIESAIPQYRYDPARAQQLLSGAGWVRGADGVLAYNPTGERLAGELWSNTRVIALGEKQLAIIGQDFKAVGAEFSIYTIPPSRANDREHEAKFPTANLTTTPVTGLYQRLDSRNIASDANSWSGRNKMAYINPRVDQLLDRIGLAVESRTQAALERELAQEIMGEAVFLPLYWEVQPVVMAANVKGDIYPNNSGWNVFTWGKT